MSEEKTVSKPRQLWDSAVKAVKGNSTEQLVETFTTEMTLVAEGLCEDQNTLRRELSQVRNQAERLEARADNDRQVLDASLREHQKEIDQRLDAMERRLSAIENRAASREAKKKREANWISQLTLLASIIAGAWIIVTVLNLFK